MAHTPSSPNPLETLEARSIMQRDLVTVEASMPLSEVERVLSDNRISGAPVVDSRGTVVGIVSLRDLVDRYTEDPDARPRRGKGSFYLAAEELGDEDYDASETPAGSEETAGDVMTTDVLSVDASVSLTRVASIMSEHRIHRLLVTENDTPTGLISSMDMLVAVAKTGRKPSAKRAVQ